MKKAFLSLVLALLALAAFAQGNNVYKTPFRFKTLDGKLFTNANLKPNKSTVVVFFDPYCEHCATQAGWLGAGAAKLKNVQFLFVTTEPTVQASIDFKAKYFTGKNMDVTILLDTDFKFDAYFGYSEAISMYVYKKTGERSQSFKKETPVDKMIPFF